MNRLKKIELLDLLKNKKINHEQFAEKIDNEGKTRFRVIVKKLDGTYSCGGKVFTKVEMDKSNEKFRPDRKIKICPKNYK